MSVKKVRFYNFFEHCWYEYTMRNIADCLHDPYLDNLTLPISKKHINYISLMSGNSLLTYHISCQLVIYIKCQFYAPTLRVEREVNL